MLYGIISDLHSNIEALDAVLEYGESLGVQKYICLGDVVGYNANPKQVMDKLRELKPVAVIKGNHDEYVSQQGELIGFNKVAAQAVEWTRSQLDDDDRRWLNSLALTKNLWQLKTTIVHSTLDSPEAWGYIFDKYYAENSFSYQRLPFCFIGHSHVPFAYEQIGGAKGTIQAGRYEEIHLNPNHKYLINVGSVGQPRDGDPRAAFVTFDTDDGQVKLTCEKLTVKLNAKKEIVKIIAEDDVKIRKEDVTSESNKAEYFLKEKKFVLTGNPILKSGTEVMRSPVITFFRDTDIIKTGRVSITSLGAGGSSLKGVVESMKKDGEGEKKDGKKEGEKKDGKDAAKKDKDADKKEEKGGS